MVNVLCPKLSIVLYAVVVQYLCICKILPLILLHLGRPFAIEFLPQFSKELIQIPPKWILVLLGGLALVSVLILHLICICSLFNFSY